MKNYPEPDMFVVIYAEINEDFMWNVVGCNDNGPDNARLAVIESNFANRQIADGFIEMYVKKYVKENFFYDGPRDC